MAKIFDKIVLSQTPPDNINVLWLTLKNGRYTLQVVGLDGWEEIFIQDLSIVTMTEGEKITGRDAGVISNISLTDDYLYVCVESGDAANAIWKKFIICRT